MLPQSPPKGSKTKSSCFLYKSGLLLKKVCYKVSLCENFQWQSCRAFAGLFIHAKWLVGDVPFYQKFGANWPNQLKIADFGSIFAHSISAVTPSEKGSTITNRKSTKSFLMSRRWTAYVAPKPPKGPQKCEVTIIRIKVDLSCKRSMLLFFWHRQHSVQSIIFQSYFGQNDPPCRMVSLQ